MIKNGKCFNKLVLLVLLFTCDNTYCQSFNSINLGCGLSDAFGYKFATKPIFYPTIKFASNFDISKNNNHWIDFTCFYRQKGTKYSQNQLDVRHQRGFLGFKLSYKYAFYQKPENKSYDFICLGLEDAYLFLGSNTKINGVKIPSISGGRKGWRNWSCFLGYESKSKRLTYCYNILIDLNSYNPNSFENDSKIYFLGMEITLGYVFY